MFDEDAWSGEQSLLVHPFAPDARIEEAKAEAAALDLPFDLANYIDYNPYVFGNLGNGNEIGQWVYHHGGHVQTLAGDSADMAPRAGLIVGAEFGRYVLAFEDEKYGWTYLGWVLPETFEKITVHGGAQSWTH